MKDHAIIPIFIPHKGCNNECVFCNQRRITAHSKPLTPSDIHKTVREYMSTLSEMNMSEIELSFFGGSFTGIPIDEQKSFLAVAKDYKDRGIIQKIHLSTRPDYIDEPILENLKAYSVDTIELGAQSFSDHVLAASHRGHDSAAIYDSCRLIKDHGFNLGIQLMIGLPGDTPDDDIFSARETVRLAPSIARLYPTVVIEDTGLYDMYREGTYRPLGSEEAIRRTAAMYRIIDSAGINIIRVGLKSSDIINDKTISSGTFHPAFRQLVEGLIAREDLEAQLEEMPPASDVVCVSHPDSFNNMIGHKAANKSYFSSRFSSLHIKYTADESVKKGVYSAFIKKEKQ